MILLFLFLLLTPAAAHEMHGIDYSKWLMPSPDASRHRKHSCCNSVDCAPRQTRFKNGHWEVLFEGRWLPVPDMKVETNYDDAWDPGDHMGHGCISPSGNVYCLRPGEFLQ
jgi:hypothetical protein